MSVQSKLWGQERHMSKNKNSWKVNGSEADHEEQWRYWWYPVNLKSRTINGKMRTKTTLPFRSSADSHLTSGWEHLYSFWGLLVDRRRHPLFPNWTFPAWSQIFDNSHLGTAHCPESDPMLHVNDPPQQINSNSQLLWPAKHGQPQATCSLPCSLCIVIGRVALKIPMSWSPSLVTTSLSWLVFVN